MTLAVVALAAALVNGALGYGFSSITMPIALLFLTNRALNPAMVLIELAVNAYTVAINRDSLGRVWRRVAPIVLGSLPGVLLGSYLLSRLSADWLKLWTYASLLPLILLQAAGIRRPLAREAAVGVPFGAGLGALYSVTTISGPPLAVLLNNQGFAKQEFRVAMGLIRLGQGLCAVLTYYYLGLFGARSGRLLLAMIPSVALGMPLGARLVGRVDPEVFRRVCMSFDAWLVGFGLSKVALALGLLSGLAGYAPLAAAVAADAVLMAGFVRRRYA